MEIMSIISRYIKPPCLLAIIPTCTNDIETFWDVKKLLDFWYKRRNILVEKIQLYPDKKHLERRLKKIDLVIEFIEIILTRIKKILLSTSKSDELSKEFKNNKLEKY